VAGLATVITAAIWMEDARRARSAWFAWTEADTRTALESELALAGNGAFYAVLLPARGELQLVCRGAVLESFPVVRCEVARPRFLFFPRGGGENWKGKVWTEGRLDPPRLAHRPVPTGDDETAVPPTPEEAFPAPGRWTVEFPGTALIEVVGLDPSGRERPATRPPALADGTGGIRIVLAAPEADRLYRGLPDKISWIVRG